MKTAYWMRYHDGHYKHAAVIADSLDEAFNKLEARGYDPGLISFRGRIIDVVE